MHVSARQCTPMEVKCAPGGCDARVGETMHTNGGEMRAVGCDARAGETMHTNGDDVGAVGCDARA